MGINHQPFRTSNSELHRIRAFGVPWWKTCSLVNVEKLKAEISVELIKIKGGLDYEERQILKLEVAKIQIKKEKYTRDLEAKSEPFYEKLRKVI